MFEIFPRDTLLRVGDTWLRSFGGNGGERTVTYTMEGYGIRDGATVADLTGDGRIEHGGTMELGPVSVDLDLSGTVEETLEFDVLLGAILRSRTDISLDGTGALSGGQGEGSSADLYIDMEGRLERVE
jgi:hypothetical protein